MEALLAPTIAQVGILTHGILRIVSERFAGSLAEPVGDNEGLGLLDLLPACNETEDEVDVQLAADCSGEGLVRYSFIYCLLAEADRIDDALHFTEFLLRHDELFACDILIISEMVSVVCHWRLAVLGLPRLLHRVTILLCKFSAEVVNQVPLLISQNQTLLMI